MDHLALQRLARRGGAFDGDLLVHRDGRLLDDGRQDHLAGRVVGPGRRRQDCKP